MKIKSVCEATGLSDRAIRYYIDEGLVSPVFTENYLGRRTFDFSDDDINDLSTIATLRKYDFSIPDISTMERHPEQISEIVARLIARKKDLVGNEEVLIASLEKAAAKELGDISSLAKALQVSELPSPDVNAELSKSNRILRVVHRVLVVILALAPIVCGLVLLNESIAFHRFPVVSPIFVVLALLFLVPSVLMLLLPFIKKNAHWKRIACIVLCVLILISVPLVSFCAFGIVSHSETHDYFRYLEVDERIASANGYSMYRFFPDETHFYKVVNGESVDMGRYLYRNQPAWNYAYDIFAEWQASEEEIDAEISRITSYYESKASENTWWDQCRIQRGAFECIVLYQGNEPFTRTNDAYTYYVFAYDKTTLCVRYVLCDSLEHSDEFQPYYLELEWD